MSYFTMTKDEHFFFKDIVFPEHANSVYWKGKRYSKEDIIKMKDILHKINKVRQNLLLRVISLVFLHYLF